MGYEFGGHWAKQDATPEQLLTVKGLGNGRNWVASQTDPAKEFTRIIGLGEKGFMDTGTTPSPSFVAGVIDGAQMIEPST